jgi:hypothetical protein
MMSYINYSRLGRVWYVASRLGTGISKSIFTLCKYDLTFSFLRFSLLAGNQNTVTVEKVVKKSSDGREKEKRKKQRGVVMEERTKER